MVHQTTQPTLALQTPDRFERVTSSSRAGNLDNIGGRFNTIAAGAGSRLDSLTAGLAAPTPGAGASMNVSRGTDRHNNLPTTDRAPGRDATAKSGIHVLWLHLRYNAGMPSTVGPKWQNRRPSTEDHQTTAESPTGPGATLAADEESRVENRRGTFGLSARNC